MQTETRIAKFWSMVDVGKPEECWPWTGKLYNGYGFFALLGKSRGAHRASFTIAHGAIPDGMWVDHVCRNRACVNPAHLRAVTPKTNALENNIGLTAQNAVKTHCDKGHKLAGENLRIEKRGWRLCVICQRAHNRAYRARLSAARLATSRSQHEGAGR